MSSEIFTCMKDCIPKILEIRISGEDFHIDDIKCSDWRDFDYPFEIVKSRTKTKFQKSVKEKENKTQEDDIAHIREEFFEA